MATKDWKNLLLKSGLPFEYEVKECFVNQGCQVGDEYSYIKPDENQIEKEFSYDLDVSYIEDRNFLTFMVECKYKTEPTKWFFLPDPNPRPDGLSQNCFFHTVDHFKKDKFLPTHYPYENIQKPLGPICLKGVEIFQNQFLEKSISRAVDQLSYAFVEQVISSFANQLEIEPFFDTNFFNIPMIITNADLHLMNEKLTTSDIEKAKDIEEISSKHDFLLFHNIIGESLKRHNKKALDQYFSKTVRNKFSNRNHSFAKEVDHLVQVTSQYYCPKAILIMNHDPKHENYKKLFNYIKSPVSG